MVPVQWVAVIGAGPAGLFAARELAAHNIGVVIINRDIKPGGLAEYGIYPDKRIMKEGLRAQFRKILAVPGIHYFGNLEVGCQVGLCPDELLDLGFAAVLVAVGAQGTKWTGLPGEDLQGVYHAKDVVYHYNHLPPFSEHTFQIGKKVAVIGAGNVSLDITHFLSSLPHVEEVTAVIRRGPGEVKFDQRELQYVACMVDWADLDTELNSLSPVMHELHQNPEDFKNWVLHSVNKAGMPDPCAHFLLRFMRTPTRILGDSHGRVCGMEVELNTLYLENGEVKVRRTGTHQVMDVDTVIFAIGDRVDDRIGLPVVGNEYVKSPTPRFPVGGLSYEVFDPVGKIALDGVFVAGWAREASKGLVGVARRDGTMAAEAIMQYLQTLPGQAKDVLRSFLGLIARLGQPVVTLAEVARLDAVEKEKASQLGLEEFAFISNAEMLAAVGIRGLQEKAGG